MSSRPGKLWDDRTESSQTPSLNPQASRNKPKRGYHPKTRNGCLTCKRRRIKCDETRPTCLRCRASIYECLGYEGAAASTSTSGSSELKSQVTLRPKVEDVPVPLSDLQLTGDDALYFDNFRFNTAGKLVGFANTERFSRAIIQLASSDELYKKTILAIGALYCAVFSSVEQLDQLGAIPISLIRLHGQGLDSPHHQAAVRHHIDAIALYRQRVEGIGPRQVLNSPISGSVVLMFLSFEQIQGNYEALYYLALQMQVFLRDTVRKDKGAKQASGGSKSAESQEVDTPQIPPEMRDFDSSWPIAQIFPLGAFLGCNSNTTPAPIPVPDAVYPSIDDGPDIAYMLCRCDVGQTDVFLREICLHKHKGIRDPDVAASLRERSLKFVAIHRKWMDVLQRRLDAEDSRMTWARLKGMSLFCGLYMTILMTIFDADEIGYDGAAESFSDILDDAMALLRHRPSGDKSPVRLLPIVSFIACKCRDREVRSRSLQAIDILETVEDSWSTGLVLQAIRALVMLEEGARDKAGLVPPEARYGITGMHWVMNEGKLVVRLTQVASGCDGVHDCSFVADGQSPTIPLEE